ncbi:phosphoglucosamine mutase [Miniphocaeibacter massiliensis]|uniref:phosphoglucosamine mutase n=1 Tax=Miniphocaeibacter massiliensis TaxID=2041841 RepID=UPI000C06A6F5|nr:phosphoglucosamine mutase [Miniphocaeibacter massiliensis]
MGKYFGTDGIRGIANTELTPELAFKVARASAHKLENNHKKLIIIGKDTRKSGDLLESALVAGYTSMGFDVYLLGVIPTPAVAYLTRYYNAAAGIVISASHNPAEFNGIKYFGPNGFKLPDEVEDDIEKLMDEYKTIELRPTGSEVGIVERKEEAIDIYIKFLESTVKLDLTGKKIALDCGNGATYSIAPKLFKDLGAEVEYISVEPNGLNINDNCGSTNPSLAQELVKKMGADIGFTFDGDGDRLITIDENGEILDGDHFLAACAFHMKNNGTLKNNGIVGTVMTNIGLDEYANSIEVKVEKASVGDRYVLELMQEGGYNLGGEQSGHIIFLDNNTTGDGILSALKISETMMDSGKKMSDLNKLMITYPQVLVNAKVKNDNKHSYMEDEVIVKEIKELEDKFNGSGRVLIRPSGTEPLVRVMIEGKDQSILEKEANRLASIIEERLS